MDKIDGRYLKDLRMKSGYSLRTLADKIYVSKSSLQRWEKTEVPEFEDIREKLADVFNVTADEMCSQSAMKYGNSQSDMKYGEKTAPVVEENEMELDSESLAELKFGVKGIIISVALLSVVAIISLIAFIL